MYVMCIEYCLVAQNWQKTKKKSVKIDFQKLSEDELVAESLSHLIFKN